MSKALVLVTFDRENLFKSVYNSINRDLFDNIVVVHDVVGSSYSEDFVKELTDNCVYLKNTENLGVGKSKQKGLDWVMNNNSSSEYIFVVEDDVIVKNNEVWDYYILFSKKSGIWHTNWNDCVYESKKYELDFDGVRGVVCRELAGAFSFFHRNVLKFCRFSDDMKNSFDMADLQLQLISNSLSLPFWHFVSPKNSGKYLKYSDEDSTITDRNGYTENYQKSLAAFKQKYGLHLNHIKEVSNEKAVELSKFLKLNYSKV